MNAATKLHLVPPSATHRAARPVDSEARRERDRARAIRKCQQDITRSCNRLGTLARLARRDEVQQAVWVILAALMRLEGDGPSAHADLMLATRILWDGRT